MESEVEKTLKRSERALGLDENESETTSANEEEVRELMGKNMLVEKLLTSCGMAKRLKLISENQEISTRQEQVVIVGGSSLSNEAREFTSPITIDLGSDSDDAAIMVAECKSEGDTEYADPKSSLSTIELEETTRN